MVRVHGHARKDRVPRVLSWADPNSVRVGDEVVAVGFARDLRGRPTVTRGIVGATQAARRRPPAANRRCSPI